MDSRPAGGAALWGRSRIGREMPRGEESRGGGGGLRRRGSGAASRRLGAPLMPRGQHGRVVPRQACEAAGPARQPAPLHSLSPSMLLPGSHVLHLQW
jgi:hypothetical protein